MVKGSHYYVIFLELDMRKHTGRVGQSVATSIDPAIPQIAERLIVNMIM